jgi:magnesium transporter
MIKYFLGSSEEDGFKEVEQPQSGCWIHLEAPSIEEINSVIELTGITEYFMKSALDEEEAAHVDTQKGTKLVVIDIPKSVDGAVHTLPLALMHHDNYLVSVCTAQTTVLDDFFMGKVKNIDTQRRTKLVYQIMYNSAARFLYYLRQIDKKSATIQKTLSKSMQNQELLELVELQKTLVFFSASLSANHTVIQKIATGHLENAKDDERDILEDVVLENMQAREMCSVYREIIKSTMDAFAAVVNNNQNMVMKFLTAITIVLSIPMVVSGLWGMNTGVPFEGKLWGFWAATGIALIISAIIYFFMARKKML